MGASLRPNELYQVHEASDSIWLSARIKERARLLGFDKRSEGNLAIVVSELVSNALKFGKRATLRLVVLESPSGIEICVSDDGPGFEDRERAFIDGYSEGAMRDVDNPSPRGLGLGLGAVSRLMDEVEILNLSPCGASVTVRLWLRAGEQIPNARGHLFGRPS